MADDRNENAPGQNGFIPIRCVFTRTEESMKELIAMLFIFAVLWVATSWGDDSVPASRSDPHRETRSGNRINMETQICNFVTHRCIPVCDDEFVYYPKFCSETNEETGESVMADDGIWKYAPTDHSKTRITETNGTGPCKLLYVTDNYLYYSPYEKTEVGADEGTYSTVWRVEKNGGDPEQVFAVSACDVDGLCVGDNVAILTVRKEYAPGAFVRMFYRMTVEADGTFSGLQTIR